jgi:hypothetical protein
MRKGWYSVFALFGLCHLSCLTFELAGEKLTDPQIVTEEKLREKFGYDLSDVFYWAFGKAVEWQQKGKTDAARSLYDELLKSIQQNKDLHKRVNPFIQDNIDMLP